MTLGAAFVLVPGIPLISILFVTQVVNAVLLLPLLVAMRALSRREDVLGRYRNGRAGNVLVAGALAIVVVAVAGLAVASFL